MDKQIAIWDKDSRERKGDDNITYCWKFKSTHNLGKNYGCELSEKFGKIFNESQIFIFL